MKLAVIDCGTNTFNLIIIELKEDGSYSKLFNTRVPVRLGDDTINEGFISEVPFMRGIDAISTFKHHIKKFHVQRTLAFATSAIREARNGDVFVKEVRDLFDIEIQVIDGNREAELIYYGNRAAVSMSHQVSLIMDIGGGSNEFILANKHTIFWKQSFLIGAARVLEKFPHSNPITSNEKEKIESHLKEQLQPLFAVVEQYKPVELIGSSGAFDSLVEMIHGELGGEALTADKTEYQVSLAHNKSISEKIFGSTLDERRQIKGLVPMRFDMIVISCLMINFILDSFQLKKLRVSTYSLKEGALVEYIRNLALQK